MCDSLKGSVFNCVWNVAEVSASAGEVKSRGSVGGCAMPRRR